MLNKGLVKQVNHIPVTELLNVLGEYMYSYIFLLGLYQKELTHCYSIIHL